MFTVNMACRWGFAQSGLTHGTKVFIRQQMTMMKRVTSRDMQMRYYCPTEDCLLDEDEVYEDEVSTERTGVFTLRCIEDDAIVEMEFVGDEDAPEEDEEEDE